MDVKIGVEKTRRALLGAAVVGGVLMTGGGRSAAEPAGDGRLQQLAREVRDLGLAARDLDYDDPAAEAAHYATAGAILQAVIATPATSISGLQVKAEALAWCYGGRPASAPDAPFADRLVASLLDDLLPPAGAEQE